MKSVLFIFVTIFLNGVLVGCSSEYRIDKPASLQHTPLSTVINDPDIADQYPCSTDGEPNGVMICHIPPGNPSKRHTICIGRSAIPAHLAHKADTGESDYFGPCSEELL
jgi:hypothetical protein